MQIPDTLEQHGAGDHLPGPAQQVLEQFELPGRQLDAPSCARHCPGKDVHLEICETKLHFGRGRYLAPPQQRFDTRQQFGQRKRLGEVIVAARPQTLDPVIHRS